MSTVSSQDELLAKLYNIVVEVLIFLKTIFIPMSSKTRIPGQKPKKPSVSFNSSLIKL